MTVREGLGSAQMQGRAAGEREDLIAACPFRSGIAKINWLQGYIKAFTSEGREAPVVFTKQLARMQANEHILSMGKL